MNNAKHTNGRKLQHGTVNVVLSIVLIVSVILVNAIFTALAYKFNIFTDMTESNPCPTRTEELSAPPQ